MINTLGFQGFKSLQEIRNLDLGSVNVLIGANGSGKSNILEAIGVMGAAVSGRVDDQTLLRRGVRPGGPALYKTSLAGTRLRRTISFEAMGEWDNEQATYKVSLDNPIETPEKVWHYLSESLRRGATRIVSFSPRGRSFVSGLPNLGPEVARLKPYAGSCSCSLRGT
jgi:recombinational DNA repair ATPase RecF